MSKLQALTALTEGLTIDTNIEKSELAFKAFKNAFDAGYQFKRTRFLALTVENEILNHADFNEAAGVLGMEASELFLQISERAYRQQLETQGQTSSKQHFEDLMDAIEAEDLTGANDLELLDKLIELSDDLELIFKTDNYNNLSIVSSDLGGGFSSVSNNELKVFFQGIVQASGISSLQTDLRAAINLNDRFIVKMAS